MRYGSVKITPAEDLTGYDVLIQDTGGSVSATLSFEQTSDLIVWLQEVLEAPPE